jgi:enoyl-CoA hydratase/carnithine racemase
MSEDDLVRVTKPENGVAWVELNRPERMNAMNDEMVSGGLRDIFVWLESDNDVRVMVLTGAGRAFCAGGDLDAEAFSSGDDKFEFIRDAQTTVTSLLDMRKPTIAVVNGAASGGGMGLALACDIRIGGRSTFFSCPFTSMGLVPDFGASYLLTRAVGTSHAMAIALSGRRVGADESLTLGLLQELVEDPVERGRELAQSIAAAPAEATSATKQAILSAAEVSASTQILEIEPVLQARMMAGAAFRERFAAYKRKVVRESA